MRLTRSSPRLYEYLRGTLWFVPAIGVVAAIALGVALPRIDEALLSNLSGWFLFGGHAEAARELLSTITGAMMTATALVFSVTLLVLQLAANRLSPRIIRTFLHDPSTRWTMAAFIGTFVYTIVVLLQVRGGEHPVVPGFSVWFAFALVLLSIGVFLHYIDRMAQAVRTITVLRRAAQETRDAIDDLYPDEVGEEAEITPPRVAARPDRVLLYQDEPGVVAAVDGDRLLDLAKRHGAVIEVVPCVGDFVPGGAPILRVWGGPELDAGEACKAIDIGDERTIAQDAAFGLRQLVDVAVRSLSPSTNDPTTARQALELIHDLMRRLTVRRFPPVERTDDGGPARVILPRPDYAGYVALAFEEIRHFGADQIQIRRYLRRVLDDLLALAPAHRRPVLEAELGALERVPLRAAA